MPACKNSMPAILKASLKGCRDPAEPGVISRPVKQKMKKEKKNRLCKFVIEWHYHSGNNACGPEGSFSNEEGSVT